MADQPFRFEDGASYERMMGRWSRIIGATFLDWLAPRSGLQWADVGCGNGAFTELVVERFAPTAITAIDPSEGQLKFARARPGTKGATYVQGDAMALPLADDSVDAAVMALVIFFVPEPARGVAEMARVLKPGGLAAAYAWDIFGGGFPMEPIQAELNALGFQPVRPPRADASRVDALQKLWRDAGFVDLEAREISATRTFADFEDYWTTNLLSNSIAAAVAGLDSATIAQLKERVRDKLTGGADGLITSTSRANAIKGRKPV